MRTKYDYKIIINKGKTKPKLFLFLSLNETIVVLLTTGIIYKLFSIFMSEMFSMIVGIGVGVAIATLFIEIPASHLNVIQHRLAYKYYFVKPHRFYYSRRELNKNKEEDINVHIEFKTKEERYKAAVKHKKTKKSKK